ncbi:N-acetyltransferase family protein [Falsiroseomonas sp. HC035]|uniref:GNAT family N-acetyltransferase n=1 Tax=Falsiroseomonas sp. HC035 TaxID=3390999 RepID=UPI003D313680
MPLSLRSARAADAGGICALHAMSCRSAYAGMLDRDFLENDLEDALAAHWQDLLRGRRRPGQVVMAVTGHQVNGFAAAMLEGTCCQVGSLHVRPEMRGGGIGRQLLGTLAHRLRQQGALSAELWVFTANEGAIRFYRRLGGQLGPPVMREAFGQPVSERRMHWPDLAALVGACAR